MALVVPDVAEVLLLAGVITEMGALTLRLNKNPVTPSDATVLGDFTIADFSGYANASPSMTTPSEISGKGTTIDSAERSFTHNGGGTGNTIYGYYVTDAIGGLVWAEAFSAPVTMNASGHQIKITLQLTLDSENH